MGGGGKLNIEVGGWENSGGGKCSGFGSLLCDRIIPFRLKGKVHLCQR